MLRKVVLSSHTIKHGKNPYDLAVVKNFSHRVNGGWAQVGQLIEYASQPLDFRSSIDLSGIEK